MQVWIGDSRSFGVSMKALILVVFLSSSTLMVSLQGEPALRVLHQDQAASLLRNGDFEQVDAGKLAAWQPAPQGNRLAEGEGRNGSRALVCESLWPGLVRGEPDARFKPHPAGALGHSRLEQSVWRIRQHR